MNTRKYLLIALIGLLILSFGARQVLAQDNGPDDPLAALGTAFTYQGYLDNNGSPVNAVCDIRFGLWDALTGGTQIGSLSTVTNVQVSNGLFTVSVNAGSEFGTSAFTGSARWLAIETRCPAGSGSYTLLSPRQAITLVPYAAHADLLDGQHGTYYRSATNINAGMLGAGYYSAYGDLTAEGYLDLSATTDLLTRAQGDVRYAVVAHNHWGGTWSGSGTGLALSGGTIGLSGSGSTYGVMGQSDTSGGKGLYGYASATSGTTYGVWGQSNSTAGYGVYGIGTYGVSGNGTYGGVYGSSSSTNGFGVYGTGATGVVGTSDSLSGYGVYGWSSSTTGLTYGVYGQSHSTDGFGVYGYADATSGTTFGVKGYSNSSQGYGVYGYAGSINGSTFGVYGQACSTDGIGVVGYAGATNGDAKGVYGSSNSTQGTGVAGYALAASGPTYGVYGRSHSAQGFGVYGWATAFSGSTYGVYGLSDSTSGYGVYGSGATGVIGYSSSTNGFGVFGYTSSSTGYGGYFIGDVYVDGDLTVTGSHPLLIDNPINPASQYLYHYGLESSEALNQYSGNVILDANGEAWVQLPDWFSAINKDFRYQFAPIGAPAPGLYIAQEVQATTMGSRFKIAGGSAGLKVSWQLTALRNDPYTQANGTPVVVDKPAGEQGTYLYPELYGQPESAGSSYQRNLERSVEQP